MPEALIELVDELMTMPGVVAVALGGSRTLEKRLIEAAGLNALQSAFENVPAEPARLPRWVDQVAARLQVAENETMPWSDRRHDDQDLG